MKTTPRSLAPTPSLRALLAALCAASTLLAACATTTTVKCRRVEFGSMGPENGFRVTIPADEAPSLDGDDERINLAMTIVPPVAGPVFLIQNVEDRTIGRWEMKTVVPAGANTRCSLGFLPSMSPCTVVLETRPHSMKGDWSIDPGDNRVLEAGLSAVVCR